MILNPNDAISIKNRQQYKKQHSKLDKIPTSNTNFKITLIEGTVVLATESGASYKNLVLYFKSNQNIF
jgi:hypothetical protein